MGRVLSDIRSKFAALAKEDKPKVPEGAAAALRERLKGAGFESKPIPAEVERDSMTGAQRALANVYNATRSFSEGAMEVVAAPVEVAGMATGSDTLRRAAQGIRDLPAVNEDAMLASDGQRLVQPGFGSELASGAGSAAAMIGGGLIMGAGSRTFGTAGKALGQAGRAAKAVDIGLGTTVAQHAARIGALVQAQSQFRDAEANGADTATQWAAFALGSAVGASEGLAIGGTGQLGKIGQALANIDKRSGGALKKVAQAFPTVAAEGLQEAAQEGAQTFSEKMIAQQILQYAEPEEWEAIASEVGRNAMIGGIVGSGLAQMGMTFEQVGERARMKSIANSIEADVGRTVLDSAAEVSKGLDPAKDSTGEQRVQASPEEAVSRFAKSSGIEGELAFEVVDPDQMATDQDSIPTGELDLHAKLSNIVGSGGELPPIVTIDDANAAPGAYVDGVVIVNKQFQDEMLAGVALHEILHSKARAGSEEFGRLVEEAKQSFPALTLRMAAIYEQEFTASNGRKPFAALPDGPERTALLVEEGFAWGAQNMSRLVDSLVQNPESIKPSDVAEFKGVLQRIAAWLKDAVSKLTRGRISPAKRTQALANLDSILKEQAGRTTKAGAKPDEVVAMAKELARIMREAKIETLPAAPQKGTPQWWESTLTFEALPTEEDQAMADEAAQMDQEAEAAAEPLPKTPKEKQAEAKKKAAEDAAKAKEVKPKAKAVAPEIDEKLTPAQRKRLKQKRNRDAKRLRAERGEVPRPASERGPERTYRRDAGPTAAEAAIEDYERGIDRWAVVPGDDSLVALHNLSAENLAHAEEIGGIALPSLAIRKVSHGPVDGFGRITLIADRDMVDPERGVPVAESDAWTVRHPRMKFRRDDKAAQAVVDELKPHLEAAGMTTWGAFDNLRAENVGWNKGRDEAESVFTRRNSRWRLAFAESIGKPVRPFMKSPPIGGVLAGEDADLLKYLEREVRGQIDFESQAHLRLSDEVAAAVARIYPSDMSSRSDWPDTFNEDGLIYFGSLGGYERAAGALREGRTPDWTRRVKAAERKTGEEAYRNWYMSLLDRIWRDPYIEMGRRKVPYSLSAVVDAMLANSGKAKEESATYGPGKVRAAVAREFGSIQDIRAAASRLTNSFSEYEETVQKPLMDAYHEAVLPAYKWDSTFDALDGSMKALASSVSRGKVVPAKLRRALRRNDFAGDIERGVEAGVRLGEAILAAPSEYFEAKPQRAVAISEFKAALVPKGDAASIAILERAGVPVTAYSGTEARANALEKAARKSKRSGDDIRFATSPTIEVDGTERPRLNSEGRPIAGTDEALRAFYRWFGESKVVDEQGRPLVVYHGTTGEFYAFSKSMRGAITKAESAKEGFFFIDRADVAGEYAEAFGSRDAREAQRAVEETEAKARQTGKASDWDANAAAVEEYERIELEEEPKRKTPLGSNILPVYLSIQDPRSFNFKGEMWDEGRLHSELKAAQSAGRDGQVFENVHDDPVEDRIGTVYVAFSPTQIKSATGNQGTFSPSDPDIRRATAPQEGDLADVAQEGEDSMRSIQFDRLSRFDQARRAFQDFFLPVRQLQKALEEEAGAEMPDEMNVSRAQRLYYGKLDEALNANREKVEKELSSILGKDITLEEAHDYALAKHAPEANAYIYKQGVEAQKAHDALEAWKEAKRKWDAYNKDVADGIAVRRERPSKPGRKPAAPDADWMRKKKGGGQEAILWHPESNPASSVRSSVATKLVRDLESGPLADRYKRLDAFLRRQSRKRIKILRESGEMSPALEEAIAKTGFKHYVPLVHEMKRRGKPKMGMAKGFQSTGPGIKRRGGRKSAPDNVVLNTVRAVEDAIFKAEKKRVVDTLRKLIEAFPDKNFWNIYDVPVKVKMDQDGIMREHWEMREDWREDAIQFYDGEGKGRKAKVIVFNDKAQALSRAFKGGNVEESGAIMKAMRAYVRYQSAINTSLNLEFVFTNFVKDLQTAGLVLGEGQGWKAAKDISKRAPSAVRGIYRSQRGKDSEWTPWWDRLRAAGGKTGYFHARGVEEIQADMEKAIRKAMDSPEGLRKGIDYAAKVLEFITELNEAVENGVRLSAFRYAVEELGMSDTQAAELAKTLTIDFNTRGEQRWLSGMYMFANAGIQGTARMMASTVTTKRGRKIAASIMLFAAMLDQLNYWLSGDDDDGRSRWDANPEHEKDRYLQIYTGMGESGYLSVPMPYGYSFFATAGRTMSAMARTSAGRGETGALEGFANMASSAMSSFSPVGDAHDVSYQSALRLLSPTITDPLVELAVNQDWKGSKIYSGASDFDRTPGPRSESGRDYTADVWKDAARLMNSATGGDKFSSGGVDIHPETLRYIFGVGLGGTARVFNNALDAGSLATKGDMSAAAARAPFVRHLFREESARKGYYDYYANSQDVLVQADLYENYLASEEPGHDLKAAELYAEVGPVIDLAGEVKLLEKIRKQMQKEIAATTDDDERARLEVELYAEIRAFNRTFQEAKSDQ